MNISKELKKKRDFEDRLRNRSPMPTYFEGAGYINLASLATKKELFDGLGSKANTDHIHAFLDLSDTPVNYTADKFVKVNSAGNALELGDGVYYELPQATEFILGGIMAKSKTTESSEVAIDITTGKLYSTAPSEAINGLPAGGSAGQVLRKIDGSDYNVKWENTGSGDISILQREILRIKMRQTGLNLDPNAWSDSLDDLTGINTELSSGYSFDSNNISAQDIYTKLLLHMNGENNSAIFTDACGKTVTPSGNTVTSTAQSKFGGTSAHFDGSGDYLSILSSDDFNFGSGNFTIDFWMYQDGTKQSGDVVQKGGVCDSKYPDIDFAISAANTMAFNLYVGPANVISITGISISASKWHHVAFVRNGSTFSVYIDGVSKGSGTYNGTLDYDNAEPFLIGYQTGQPTSHYYLGYIDEFRVSKGIARWTADFTPLTIEYTLGGSGEGIIIWNAITSESVLNNAIVEAIQTLGTGTINYYISRDGGTTFTQCSLDVMTDISAQPGGTSIVLKAVISGDSILSAVAVGGN